LFQRLVNAVFGRLKILWMKYCPPRRKRGDSCPGIDSEEIKHLWGPFDAASNDVPIPGARVGGMESKLQSLGCCQQQFLGPFALGDVRADAQDFDHPTLCVLHDSVGPGDPDALAVAAHVLIDIVFEGDGVGANLIHEPTHVASAVICLGDDGVRDVSADNLLGGVAKESLPELVEEGDPPIMRPVQDDAVRVLHEFAILPFALGEAFFRSLALGDVLIDAR
jgi:hypothetical protein